jgi:hypothetical protein
MTTDICLFSAAPRPPVGPTQLPMNWMARDFALGLKLPKCKTYLSRPSSAKIKN